MIIMIEQRYKIAIDIKLLLIHQLRSHATKFSSRNTVAETRHWLLVTIAKSELHMCTNWSIFTILNSSFHNKQISKVFSPYHWQHICCTWFSRHCENRWRTTIQRKWQSSIPNVHEVYRRKNKCSNSRRPRSQWICRKLYESTRQNLTHHPYWEQKPTARNQQDVSSILNHAS